jgi:hypothetical protein
MTTIASVFGHRYFRHGGRAEKLISSDKFLGVELEYNRIASFGTKWWSAEADGSLRDNGIEFVLRMPLSGSDLVDAISEVLEKVGPANLDLDTSMHVHANSLGSSLQDIGKFLLTCHALEHVLFHHDPYRRSSSFCKQYTATAPALIDRLRRIIQSAFLEESEDFKVYVRAFSRYTKYWSFSVKSLIDFGTVEFRTFQAPATTDEAIAKLNIVMALMLLAEELPDTPEEAAIFLKERGAVLFNDLINLPIATTTQIKESLGAN